jgi:hypothetical protein
MLLVWQQAAPPPHRTDAAVDCGCRPRLPLTLFLMLKLMKLVSTSTW